MQPQTLVLIVLFGGLLFLMFSRTRRQQRETQNLQARLEVGARIMTTAGLYATVVELETSAVTLETAPGQHSRWDRRAIARVLTDEAAADDAPAVADPSEAEPGDRGQDVPEYGTTPDDGPAPAASSQDAAPPDRA